jgi:cyclase
MTDVRPSFHELADGVFAYIQPPGGWCLNNAGLVTGGGTTILVDTAATEARARRLREHVLKVSPHGADLLVNTHHHGDHIFGNAQFAPGATVVAHDQARTEMIEAGLGLRQLWPEVDWGETPLVLPSLTFRDTVTLHAGGLRVQLIHVGPAHTTNDVVAWLPEQRVLFAGDVLMSGTTPFCLMGSIEGSIRAVERLRALGARTIVPGHGAVSGPEILGATERYLRWVQALAREGVAAGRSPLKSAHAADLGEFAELLDTERLVCNLHRAYWEIAGQPLGTPIDILPPFQDMVAYHGRLPACHA